MNIPYSIKSLLYGSNENNEEIIYENDYFTTIKDIKHNKNIYHYTAWIKKDVRSLLEINKDILDYIIDVKNNLLQKNLINSDDYVFIHFPPNIWRLHIHFVNKNYKFEALYYEIFFLNEVIENIYINPNFYIENVLIKSKL